jgi:hypothetical protein
MQNNAGSYSAPVPPAPHTDDNISENLTTHDAADDLPF